VRRFLFCFSPIVGVLLGLVGVAVFRHQPSADAMIPRTTGYVAQDPAQTSRPETSKSAMAAPSDSQARPGEAVAKP